MITDEQRKQYRELMVQEDKKESANNCRFSLDIFFAKFPPKKKREITYVELITALAPLMEGRSINFEWADEKWRVFDLETIKEIREYAWWKQDNPTGGLGYELDFHDCDDFAEFSKSLWALFWDTNSLGRCKGNAIFGKEITPHAFDIVLAIDEDDKVKAYLFDTEFNTEPVLLTKELISYNKTSWTITNIRI